MTLMCLGISWRKEETKCSYKVYCWKNSCKKATKNASALHVRLILKEFFLPCFK
jgi:hypothetical protein